MEQCFVHSRHQNTEMGDIVTVVLVISYDYNERWAICGWFFIGHRNNIFAQTCNKNFKRKKYKSPLQSDDQQMQNDITTNWIYWMWCTMNSIWININNNFALHSENCCNTRRKGRVKTIKSFHHNLPLYSGMPEPFSSENYLGLFFVFFFPNTNSIYSQIAVCDLIAGQGNWNAPANCSCWMQRRQTQTKHFRIKLSSRLLTYSHDISKPVR